MKFVLKRKVLLEGDKIESLKEIRPIASFRIKYFRDGVSTVALEVWYLEVEV